MFVFTVGLTYLTLYTVAFDCPLESFLGTLIRIVAAGRFSPSTGMYTIRNGKAGSDLLPPVNSLSIRIRLFSRSTFGRVNFRESFIEGYIMKQSEVMRKWIASLCLSELFLFVVFADKHIQRCRHGRSCT